jgi:hypothetical protein
MRPLPLRGGRAMVFGFTPDIFAPADSQVRFFHRYSSAT